MPGSFGTNKSPKPTFITSITEKNHPIVVEENTPPLPSSQHNKDNNVDADSGSDCSPLQCCQLYSSSSSSLSSQQNHASKDNDDNGNGCDGGNHHNGVDAGEVNARVTKRPRLLGIDASVIQQHINKASVVVQWKHLHDQHNHAPFGTSFPWFPTTCVNYGYGYHPLNGNNCPLMFNNLYGFGAPVLLPHQCQSQPGSSEGEEEEAAQAERLAKRKASLAEEQAAEAARLRKETAAEAARLAKAAMLAVKHIANASAPIDLSDVPQLPPLPKNKGQVKEGASKYNGVYFHKASKKWLAQIKIEGKIHHIGYYENEEEAGIDFARALFKYNGKSAVVEKNETKYRRRRGKEMSDEHVMKVAAILAKQRSRLTGTNIDPNEFAKKMKESKGGFCFL